MIHDAFITYCSSGKYFGADLLTQVIETMSSTTALIVALVCASLQLGTAFVPNNINLSPKLSSVLQSTTTQSWFPVEEATTPTVSNGDAPTTQGKIETALSSLSVEQLKAQILQLGATLDRGQGYNPTSGAYYSGTMLIARKKVEELVSRATSENVPTTLEDMEGEWELVFTTVPHGIFRSSPFFLAVQEAFEYAETKGNDLIRLCMTFFYPFDMIGFVRSHNIII